MTNTARRHTTGATGRIRFSISVLLEERAMTPRYSTARVSKRRFAKSTACLRARYCTDHAFSDLEVPGLREAHASGGVGDCVGVTARGVDRSRAGHLSREGAIRNC